MNVKEFIKAYYQKENIEEVLLEIITHESPATYREIVDKIKIISVELAESIEKRRCKRYDKIMKTCTDIEEIPLIKKRLIEVLIDRYFKDIPANFLLNLRQLLNYVNNNEERIIEQNRFQLYLDIFKVTSLSNKEIIEFYKSLDSNYDYVTKFYEDLRNAKNHAYRNLNNNAISPSNMKIDPVNTKYNNVPIYSLHGQPFNAFIHITSCDRKSSDQVYWFDNCELETLSLSYINQDRIGMYRSPAYNVVLGFNNLKLDQIKHIYHVDSYTDGYEGTSRVNEILDSKSLMKKTTSYNEILYQHNPEVLFPSYVLAFDKIQKADLETAKALKIPIVLLYTFSYDFKKTKSLYYAGDDYLTADDENEINTLSFI